MPRVDAPVATAAVMRTRRAVTLTRIIAEMTGIVLTTMMTLRHQNGRSTSADSASLERAIASSVGASATGGSLGSTSPAVEARQRSGTPSAYSRPSTICASSSGSRSCAWLYAL